MDAKPQRPRFRVHDENMPPPALPAKTLHQRTKSVPAFSSMQNGVNKIIQAANVVAAKKVLGEVNANQRLIQPAKDDSVLGKKLVGEDNLKLAPLVRAATRPLTTRTSSNAVQAMQATQHQPLAIPQEPVKELIHKKSTKVLRTSDGLNGQSEQIPSTISSQTTSDLSIKSSQPQQTSSTEEVKPIAASTIQELKKIEPLAHLPPRFQSEKDYVNYLENQAEHFESEYNSEVNCLPPYAASAQMPAQPREEKRSYYDDTTTAQSFELHESTAGVTTILLPECDEQTKVEIKAAKIYVDANQSQEDIEDEWWDVSMVAEYNQEIFQYMGELELRMVADPRYMERQTELQWSMRAVLIDWVVQVHARFSLLPETLFLTVNYIDRFLSRKIVSLGKLQLVGATALFIAAKFEEVNCPTLSEVIFMVDGGYSADELLKAERFMLSMLSFDLGWPGPLSFLRRVSKADDYDLETRTLAKYFLEVTIMDERFVGLTPSFLAAGAHCMARLMLRKGDWSVGHVAYSGYTYNQLLQLLNGMLECCENPHKHHMAVYEKYTDKRFKRASTFVEGEMMKGFTLPSKTTSGLAPVIAPAIASAISSLPVVA